MKIGRRARFHQAQGTTERPGEGELMEMADGIAMATDGCTVEPDGHCPHGHQSWLLQLGVI